MGVSMSVSAGAPAGKRHNVRSEFREGLAHVSKNRTSLNIVLVDESLEDTYSVLFGDAVAEHNAKVAEKHPERVYGPGTAKGTYLDAMKASKREKASYELVVQVGNRETNPATDPACRGLSAEIYRRYLELFTEKFPHLRVVTAAIHMDESTPHLHIEYVPWTNSASTRGLSCRNSQRGAYKQDGYPNNEEASKAMFELLEQAALEHGIERVEMGCTEAHLSVQQFKERMAAGADYKYRNDPELLKLIEQQQELIEQQQGIIDDVCAPSAGLFKRFDLEKRLEEIRKLCSRLDLPGRAASLRAKVEAIPQVWYDFVINPVTEGLTQARETYLAKYQEAKAALSGRVDAREKVEELDLEQEIEEALEVIEETYGGYSLDDHLDQIHEARLAIERGATPSWGDLER